MRFGDGGQTVDVPTAVDALVAPTELVALAAVVAPTALFIGVALEIEAVFWGTTIAHRLSDASPIA